MLPIPEMLLRTLLTGIGATAVMDIVASVAKLSFNIPTSNWAMVGRWLGHFPQGAFRHQNIATASAVRGEAVLGWSMHYLTGIVYAALAFAIGGLEWVGDPTPGLALALGVSTLVAPFFVMQPCMGYGIAAWHTPNPTHVRLRSFMNHVAFGLGLYVTAVLLSVYFPLDDV